MPDTSFNPESCATALIAYGATTAGHGYFDFPRKAVSLANGRYSLGKCVIHPTHGLRSVELRVESFNAPLSSVRVSPPTGSVEFAGGDEFGEWTASVSRLGNTSSLTFRPGTDGRFEQYCTIIDGRPDWMARLMHRQPRQAARLQVISKELSELAKGVNPDVFPWKHMPETRGLLDMAEDVLRLVMEQKYSPPRKNFASAVPRRPIYSHVL